MSDADSGLCASCRWHGDLAFNENHPEHEIVRICEHPSLQAYAAVDPRGDAIATLPTFGCVQWEAADAAS